MNEQTMASIYIDPATYEHGDTWAEIVEEVLKRKKVNSDPSSGVTALEVFQELQKHGVTLKWDGAERIRLFGVLRGLGLQIATIEYPPSKKVRYKFFNPDDTL